MCLIVVGWRVHPDYPLVVAANRDEFYARPSAPLARWVDAPHIASGLDLEAGGTWLGITEAGRFAAITNVREPGAPQGTHSRGNLPREFLASTVSANDYANQIDGKQYSGFNLLLADNESLVYCSNRDAKPRQLMPGTYGLSNHRLDSPWPKLLSARENFARALPLLPDKSVFFKLLADQSIVADEDLPKTGVSIEWERLLSPIFVQSGTYGTRASTLLWRDTNGAISIQENSFGPYGRPLQSSVISTSV